MQHLLKSKGCLLSFWLYPTLNAYINSMLYVLSSLISPPPPFFLCLMSSLHAAFLRRNLIKLSLGPGPVPSADDRDLVSDDQPAADAPCRGQAQEVAPRYRLGPQPDHPPARPGYGSNGLFQSARDLQTGKTALILSYLAKENSFSLKNR